MNFILLIMLINLCIYVTNLDINYFKITVNIYKVQYIFIIFIL